MQFTTALRTTRATTLSTAVGAGGTFEIRTGSPPGVGNAATGTVLVELTGVTFASASGGAITFSATAVNGAASGTPGYARLKTSGGAAVIEFTAGVGAGEASFSTTISLGGAVSLTSATLTEGNA